MKKFLLLSLFMLIQISMWSQSNDKRNCGSMEALQNLQAIDPGIISKMQQIENHTAAFISAKHNNANTIQSVITIPVVFHVVYSSSSQNISDAQIQAQVDQLNKDFARLNTDASATPSAFSSIAATTGIQFCLAVRDPNGNPTSGIERRQTTVSSFGTNDNIKYYSKGGLDAWPANSYLNFWSGNLSGGLLGYAQFPGGPNATDGVVCLYSSIGSMLKPGTALHYDLGRTATHEVGHWLNLRHIWGDDGGSCSGSDLVGDTPNQGAENYGCPSFPRTDGCSPSSPGVMFMNYMDYTYDNCMNMFTSGQSSRMNALFVSGGSRLSMLSSQGCVSGSGSSCGISSGQTSSGITTSAATLSWGPVSGALNYNIQYRVLSSSWINTSSSGTSIVLTGLAEGSNYEWQVQAVCSASTGSFSSSYFFTTLSSGTCPDNYESNNTSGTAKSISANADLSATISSATDVDWFSFSTSKPNTKVKIVLSNLSADYDVILYSSSLAQLGVSQNRGTANETIIYNQKNPRNYYVKVIGYNSAFSSSCYTLRANTGSSNWREISEPNGIPASVNNTLENLSIYPNPTSGMLNINFAANENGKATIRVMDLIGRSIFTQPINVYNGINKLTVDLKDKNMGIYFIEIQNEESRMIQRFIIK